MDAGPAGCGDIDAKPDGGSMINISYLNGEQKVSGTTAKTYPSELEARSTISALLNGFGYDEQSVSKFEKIGDNTYKITSDNANVDAIKESLPGMSVKSATSVITVTLGEDSIKSVSGKLEILLSFDNKITITRDLVIKK